LATASAVPETYHLEGDDARETLKRVGRRRLLKDAFVRFRAADGASHSRAFGHAAILVMFPALITIIGLASAFEWTTFRDVLKDTLEGFSPGPSERLLETAFERGSRGGHAVWLGGLVATILSGTFLMAQVERGLNRIYGLARDRSIGRRLMAGLAMMMSAGTLLTLSFVVLAGGDAFAEALRDGSRLGDDVVDGIVLVRWPIAVLLTFAALTLVYKYSPHRHQPSAGWLQTGTVIAALSWAALTGLLTLYYAGGGQMSQTYGPLLGVIALLTWAYATGIATYLGMSVTAQLEATRAGVPGPRTLRRFNETVRDPEETEHLETLRPLTDDERRLAEPADHGAGGSAISV